jgi:hypothetical protein
MTRHGEVAAQAVGSTTPLGTPKELRAAAQRLVQMRTSLQVPGKAICN